MDSEDHGADPDPDPGSDASDAEPTAVPSPADRHGICPFCGVGCALRHDEGRDAGVGARGAVNRRGELCPKGVAAYDVVGDDDRLTRPLVRQKGELRAASWETALSRAVETFATARREVGPDALAFFASSNCTNEENYVLAKLARVLGTNNVDNCARLCHSSTVAAMGRRFGAGAMTNTLDDLGEADVFLVCGANPAEQHPVIFSSYLGPALKGGTEMIVVDPRETGTTGHADAHLQVRPGYDIPLLNALCAVVLAEGLADEEFLAERIEPGSLDAFREQLAGFDVAAAAGRAGVDPDALRSAARRYAGADRAAAFTGMGMSQHHCGTANVHALLNLALLTGNLGKRGAGVNPLRGQNNVQGAGDVGALPDVLPGYRPVTDPDARSAVADVWGVEPPAEPGLTEVELTHRFGDEVRAAYVFGENPAVTEPNANRVADLLDEVFLVVQDVYPSETVEHADVVLPGSSFAEKDGTVTNTDRQLQRSWPSTEPPGEARRDFGVLTEFGRRLTEAAGVADELTEPGFDYGGPEAAFDELRRVAAIYAGTSYDGIGTGSQRWPFPAGADAGTDVLHVGTFESGDRRTTLEPVAHVDPADPVADGELVLTTGRTLAHFNSGAVTRRSDRLVRMRGADALRIHPEDAAERGIDDGEGVVVENERGRVELAAEVTPAVRRGTVFCTFHFADPLVNRLTGDALDPEAKIPEYKHSAVRVRVAGADGN